jgi:hypothetical protein
MPAPNSALGSGTLLLIASGTAAAILGKVLYQVEVSGFIGSPILKY